MENLENKKLFILDKVEEGEAAFNEMVKDEMIYNPDGAKYGRIVDILVLDKKTREGQAYEQIQLVIEGSDKKRYTKNWSVDFCRKYFNQLGVKSADIHHAMIVFKISDTRFKRMGMFMFCVTDGEAVIPEAYEDEGTDFSERLKKLGL